MEKNTAMKPGIDVALKFGIAPFQNDKETKTPVSLESNFSVPVKTYLHKKKNGGRKILLYSPTITAFSCIFYFSTKFPARLLEWKALNLLFFKLHITTITTCSEKIKEITEENSSKYIFYTIILL